MESRDYPEQKHPRLISPNLEGQFPVHIGDLVLLQALYAVKQEVGGNPNEKLAEKFGIAGYVIDYTRRQVSLSYESLSGPYLEYYPTRSNETNGTREYRLKGFNSYQVLSPLAEAAEDASGSASLSDYPERKPLPTTSFRAKVGDIILLSSAEKKLNVSGYVLGVRFEGVVLVHENPLTKTYENGSYSSGYRINWSKGLRTYSFKHYSQFQILKSVGETGEQQKE